jgi:hypothetical protein
MLDVVERSGPSLDALERALENAERLVSKARAMQIQAMRRLDTAQVPSRDGARSLADWVAARLDVSPDTARALVDAARVFEAHLSSELALSDGDVSFDRAVATAKLAAAGASESLIEASTSYDIAGTRRLVARRTRVTTADERAAFRDRYLAIQPSMDDSSWRLWGQLPAVEGRVVETALVRRSEELPAPVEAGSRTQRHADALVAIASDSLGGDAERSTATVPVVSIFVRFRWCRSS